jgi:chitinase
VDIDWEYPVDAGADPGLGSPADRDAYTALMKDLRTAFDALSLETGRRYEVTSAIGMAPSRITPMDYAEAQRYMDYIFIMSYDMAGGWESSTGHHTSLYGNNDLHAGFNTANAVNLLLEQGVPAGKLVIGAAYYGRGWSGVKNTGTHAPELFPLYGQGVAHAQGTWEPAVFDYRDLKKNYIGANGTGINGFTVNYDSVAEAPYLWKPSTGEFISYDSPRSIKAKADYINANALGGFLGWEIDADNGELLNAVNEGLGNSEVK